MGERVVKALMQLFAIIAKINDDQEDRDSVMATNEAIIRSFLKIEVLPSKIDDYVHLFHNFYNELGDRKASKHGANIKRTSVNSVKVLRICHEINRELTIRQKFIVLMRIMELILQNESCSELEFSFLRTVADTFRIQPQEYLLIFSLLKNEISIDHPPKESFILLNTPSTAPNHYYVAALDKPIIFIRIHKSELLFFKYMGDDSLYLNNELIDSKKAYFLASGASISTSKSDRVYQVDLVNRFCATVASKKFVLEACGIRYKFPSGKIGLRTFSTRLESGNLVGIMGTSGTGKSTLIDLLSGAKVPQKGSVTINGIDIHQQSKEMEGRIGFVPQSDLLVEELTVYENLYYSAQLTYKNATPREIKRKVLALLSDLNLSDIKHLKVGSPLKKVISGGQRKRLNIALELVREPAVLFVDEPTSGLSSLGSLNIMNLLKDLSLRGTLVVAVIHQPSSDVFKLLNELIILDKGGYQIYDGNPSLAPSHFKKALDFINTHDEVCGYCGNINPEQIFETIEAKVLNEYGIPTSERKVVAKKWHEIFLEEKTQRSSKYTTPAEQLSLPEPLERPTAWKQFKTYFARDLSSKLSSIQYVLMILLEAPLLAFLLSYFLKYYIDVDGKNTYIYYYNENIPVYLFVSILVAIFLGMTVSAEEINKDRRNLKRERFLHLSWNSYLMAKMSLLAIISAIQAFLYLLIGNIILEIDQLWFSFWLVLFTVNICANLVGLNISSAFRQTKVIYIIIPILIIPQIIFSGLIIPFDRMNPTFSHPQKVPWIGNLMISRWAYEALAVQMGSENSFAKLTFEQRKIASDAQYIKDYWIPQIHALSEQKDNSLLVKSEIAKEEAKWDNINCQTCFSDSTINLKKVDAFLSIIQRQYSNNYNLSNDSIENIKRFISLKNYNIIKEKYANESLENLLTNRNKLDKIVVDSKQNTIYQIKDPIYQSPQNYTFWNAPLFIKYKSVGPYMFSTFLTNLISIWLMSIILLITLKFEFLKRILLKYRSMRQQIYQKLDKH